jgi:hypothetical protein
MIQRMQNDAFEALLGRALRIEAAPADLAQRLDSGPRRGNWMLALISPARMAASAAVLSLLMGFALGWGNTSAADDQDLDIAAVLYAANDVGDF